MPSSAFSSLLGFLAVLAMIPVALWLLKRTPMGGATTQGLMRSVAAMPLSQNQRLVTVEVGQGEQRRWLVLGITAQSITTLHVMEPGAELPAAAANPVAPFAQLLGRLRRDQPGAGQ